MRIGTLQTARLGRAFLAKALVELMPHPGQVVRIYSRLQHDTCDKSHLKKTHLPSVVSNEQVRHYIW